MRRSFLAVGFCLVAWGALAAGGLISATTPPVGPALNSTSLYAFDRTSGRVLYQNSADVTRNAASLSKLATAYLAEQYISDFTATTTMITGDYVQDGCDGTSQNCDPGELTVNDVVNFTDLMYALLLPSSDAAAYALARKVGSVLCSCGNATTQIASHVAAMNSLVGAGNLQLPDSPSMGNPSGGTISPPVNNLSPKAAAILWYNTLLTYSVVQTIAGTASHLMTITGANARTYTINHSVALVTQGDTGVLAAKGGEAATNSWHLDVTWQSASGCVAIITTMNASTQANRDADGRAVIAQIPNDYSCVGGTFH